MWSWAISNKCENGLLLRHTARAVSPSVFVMVMSTLSWESNSSRTDLLSWFAEARWRGVCELLVLAFTSALHRNSTDAASTLLQRQALCSGVHPSMVLPLTSAPRSNKQIIVSTTVNQQGSAESQIHNHKANCEESSKISSEMLVNTKKSVPAWFSYAALCNGEYPSLSFEFTRLASPSSNSATNAVLPFWAAQRIFFCGLAIISSMVSSWERFKEPFELTWDRPREKVSNWALHKVHLNFATPFRTHIF